MNPNQLSYADSILLEFLEVTIHHVLYEKKLYPDSIFILRKKYGVPVHISRYPPLNAYINHTLESLKVLLQRKQLRRVFICFYDENCKLLEKLVFNVRQVFSDVHVDNAEALSDPYLTKLQESLRAVCLRLTVINTHTKGLGGNTTFQIHVETTESASATLAGDTDYEHFPWIEMEETDLSQNPTTVSLLPIRNIKSDLFEVELFYQKIDSSESQKGIS